MTTTTRRPSASPGRFSRISTTALRGTERPSVGHARPPSEPLPHHLAGRGRQWGRLGDRRLRGVAIGLAVLLGLLGVRFVQLQGLDAAKYREQAMSQRARTIDLSATRGQILDRHGVAFAYNVDARDVYVNPKHVQDKVATAAALAQLLGQPMEVVFESMVAPGSFGYVARAVDRDVADRIMDLHLQGVGLLPATRRIHPGRDLAANVIGFTGTDGRGLEGVEAAYDQLLAGTPGSLTVEEDQAGRRIPSGERRETTPVAGRDVQLTLDRDLQWRAQSTLARAVTATQSRGGVAIVMDPRTGDLLAMANAPAFNPDAISKFDPAALGNPATNQAFEPGSVNKVITVAAAMEAGLVAPDTPVTVPPQLKVIDRVINDAEPHPTERLTVAGVLARSSNIGAALIAQKLGAQRLHAALQAFGMGRTTGLGFPGESSGQLPPAETWSGVNTATIAYGQGISATAIQMADVYATIANGGVHVTPRLITGTRGSDGAVHPAPAGPTGRVVSPGTAETLTRMLEEVTTTNGTAPKAAIPPYLIAGKTGTANRVDPRCGCYRGYVSSFIGFAPADKPQLVVAVVLDDPQGSHFGGQIAAPVFHEIMSYALAQLRIPPTGAPPAKLRLTP